MRSEWTARWIMPFLGEPSLMPSQARDRKSNFYLLSRLSKREKHPIYANLQPVLVFSSYLLGAWSRWNLFRFCSADRWS